LIDRCLGGRSWRGCWRNLFDGCVREIVSEEEEIPCDERRLAGWLDGLNIMEYMYEFVMQ
jgi:hypothetical protein